MKRQHTTSMPAVVVPAYASSKVESSGAPWYPGSPATDDVFTVVFYLRDTGFVSLLPQPSLICDRCRSCFVGRHDLYLITWRRFWLRCNNEAILCLKWPQYNDTSIRIRVLYTTFVMRNVPCGPTHVDQDWQFFCKINFVHWICLKRSSCTQHVPISLTIACSSKS